mmetsp:Transcript_29162/g.61985  ORF Transcript_29162/g.61985 Transcript_29162/m.61985 type:complete len:238 (+) Transcript_29162:237-950(+)
MRPRPRRVASHLRCVSPISNTPTWSESGPRRRWRRGLPVESAASSRARSRWPSWMLSVNACRASATGPTKSARSASRRASARPLPTTASRLSPSRWRLPKRLQRPQWRPLANLLRMAAARLRTACRGSDASQPGSRWVVVLAPALWVRRPLVRSPAAHHPWVRAPRACLLRAPRPAVGLESGCVAPATHMRTPAPPSARVLVGWRRHERLQHARLQHAGSLARSPGLWRGWSLRPVL